VPNFCYNSFLQKELLCQTTLVSLGTFLVLFLRDFQGILRYNGEKEHIVRRIKEDVYGEKKRWTKDLLRQRTYKKDDMREFLKLCRLLSEGGKKHYADFHSGRRTGKHFSAMQNCVVKCRIGKDKEAHRRFLQEYLPQKNKAGVAEKPELFGAGAGESIVDDYRRDLVGKHFKFIVSPENSNVDCAALVRMLVKRTEAVTGYRLRWLAAVHTDTAHPHAHLLINGEDKDGRDVVFDRVFIKQTMREMARQICTTLVGERTIAEMRAEQENLHKRSRYCKLDEEIARREIGVSMPPFGSRVTVVGNESLRKRLEHLSDLGFAERAEGKLGVYFLEEEWMDKLRAVGRYNSFLRARRELRQVDGRSLVLYDAACGSVRGTVTRRYVMNDEDSWNHAVVIEARDKAWYVPLFYEPDKDWENRAVSCELQKNQRGLLVPRIRLEGGERGRERKHNRVHITR
jgi:hypothetical protein